MAFDSATQKRDLRTGVSYWQSQPMPRVPVSRMSQDITTEVLIVGAGVSGALVAESLSREHDVAIVDRRGAVKGSTPASTALVQYEIDTPLIHLARKIGFADAARAWRRSKLAIDSLAARTRDLGIHCHQIERDTLYLTGNVLDTAGLRAEQAARRAIGLEVQFLARSDLQRRFELDRPAALLSHGNFTVDPRQLTSGYLRAAVGNGAKFYSSTEVTGLDAGDSGVIADTAAGGRIRARHVVFATGYELPKSVRTKGHRIVSTYAIATRRQRGRIWPGQVMLWEASEPYLYVRTTDDGRVICGGEDEDFSDPVLRDALIGKKAAALGRKLQRFFPKLDVTAEFAWTGNFGTTDTGLPCIDRLPGKTRCWVILGFGGNGITYSRIAADIITAAIHGRADPDAELYALKR